MSIPQMWKVWKSLCSLLLIEIQQARHCLVNVLSSVTIGTSNKMAQNCVKKSGLRWKCIGLSHCRLSRP